MIKTNSKEGRLNLMPPMHELSLMSINNNHNTNQSYDTMASSEKFSTLSTSFLVNDP